VSLNTLFLQQLASLGQSKAGWYRGTHMVGMFLVGPLLGAYLVSALGSPSSYRIIALAFGMTILLSPIVFARYAPRPVAATGSGWKALRAQLAQLLKDRELARVSVVEAATQATSAFFTFFIPILGVNVAAMSAGQASSLITAKGISYIFALFFLGSPLQRLGAARGYAASFAVVAAGLALLGGTAQPPLLWLGSLVLGLGLGSVQIATLTRYAQIGLRTGYGKVSGFNALVGPTGGVLGGLVGGNAAHWFGLQTVFSIAAAAFLLGCGGLLLGGGPGRRVLT
jgi:predicted MFS family arabinose efflux permease